jgi:site-specific DNA-cytosine methylase
LSPCVALRAEGHDASEDGTGRQNLIPVLAFTERTRPDGRTFEAQEDLAYALTNPGSGGRTHSRQIAGAFGVRRLTPVECERLQGFPDGHTEGQSDSARYRQLGNAVAVPVAEWLGRRIAEAPTTGETAMTPAACIAAFVFLVCIVPRPPSASSGRAT